MPDEVLRTAMQICLSETPTISTTDPRQHSGILDLPEELIDTIIRVVKNTAPVSDFWNCLKTCRKWHRIGLAIHGCLDFSVSATIESGARRHAIQQEEKSTSIEHLTDFSMNPPSQLFLCELRSLTVHVLHGRISSPFNPVSGRNFFESLSDSLKITRKLAMFSLKFADDGWDFPVRDVPAIPETQLAKLVSVLPSTVINLEIDTAGVDLPPSEELLRADQASHLCYQISRIFPRLQHFRLRVAHVCETILDLGPDLEPCFCTKAYCGVGLGKSSCPRICSWDLRRMTVWIPTGQDKENNSFVQASKRLTEHCASHAPFTILVNQQHTHTCVLSPGIAVCTNFTWSVTSNFCSNRTSGYSDHNHRSGSNVQNMPCRDHNFLLRSPRRYFLPNDDNPRTPFPYMAEWAVESQNRWTQDSHRGCRYPICDGSQPGDPFWKTTRDGRGLWACLFPKCQIRCQSFYALQGHQLYGHPEKPHDGMYHSYYPCPSVGCSRVGRWGFYRKKELEEHLLSHHLNPCTMDLPSD
ncbi:uncharacterized protein BDR25DRAFT_370204 [Lindgomyces ingoldianus]|uniref:Uncharacterized protein n=1 Tax=Lindgomyces ingoldianus TaxID=673940 RepID=A0ACB6QVX1_9PLEO|nr:uncharacterized protein BDR25DRAFT_370204 [Lindgomyces ingoldianus]KAF2470212.1 hypothetical protein BDR25DRAFT_370204 [Lindgomyces ingoldianus]